MNFFRSFNCRIYIYALLIITAAFSISCVRRSDKLIARNHPAVPTANAIDINSASAQELAKVPRIGPKLAEDIVIFRSRHGRFRRTEHLMLIRGMSDKRYREIRDFITTE
jgi:competence ComEA-like helix-hairpin-helix protein